LGKAFPLVDFAAIYIPPCHVVIIPLEVLARHPKKTFWLCCDVLKYTATVLKFYLLAGLIFFSLSCATARTGMDQIAPEPAASSPTLEMTPGINFSQGDSILRPVTPAGKTFVMSLGPQLLELKGSYVEKHEQATAPSNPLYDGKLRRYLNLLATSSFAGSGLTGEGELAYSPLNSLPDQCLCKDWPRMVRFGLKSHWQGLRYGADYKSIDRGFVSITGATTDQARDEGQLWMEHSLGPFNVRGSFGESWEKLLNTNDMRVARGATAAFSLNRSQWGATLASTYEWTEQRATLNQETTVLTNALAGSYRPFNFLSLNPNFSIKEEWNQHTGMRTETPRTEFIFAYTPSPDSFRLTGGTSFAQSFSGDGLNSIRTFGTTAAVDWKMGKFLGKDDTLSFNFNYNQQRDFISSGNPHNDLTGMLLLKITGF
jgi:hypothetical protein